MYNVRTNTGSKKHVRMAATRQVLNSFSSVEIDLRHVFCSVMHFDWCINLSVARSRLLEPWHGVSTNRHHNQISLFSHYEGTKLSKNFDIFDADFPQSGWRMQRDGRDWSYQESLSSIGFEEMSDIPLDTRIPFDFKVSRWTPVDSTWNIARFPKNYHWFLNFIPKELSCQRETVRLGMRSWTILSNYSLVSIE